MAKKLVKGDDVNFEMKFLVFVIVVGESKPVRRLLGDGRPEVSVNCLANWSLITYQISLQSV